MPFPNIIGSSSPQLQALAIEYVTVLYRRRWLALVLLAAVIAGVATYNARAVRLYQSQASILIEQDEPNIANVQRIREVPGASIQTEVELLQSRLLARRTAAALKMTERPEFETPTEEAAIGALRGTLQVAPVRGTRIVHVRVRWPDPELAAEIANAHARHYIEYTMELRFDVSKDATEQLAKQLEEERKQVEAANRALQTYRERNDAMSLADGQNIVVENLKELNAAVTRAKTARIEREARFRELMAIRNNRTALESFPAIMANGFIQALKSDIVRLQREEVTLAQDLGDEHPTLARTREALATAERRLDAEIDRVVESVRSEHDAAVAEERNLMRALEAQKAEALALTRRSGEHATLEREVEARQQAYQALLKRANETNLATEIRATNVQLVDEARPSPTPVWPRTTFNLLMAMATGTLLAVGAVFLLEALDDRIRTPSDIADVVGAQFLGLIPRVGTRAGHRVSIVQDAPSLMQEAFRTLRTTVVSSELMKEPRTLLIASAQEGEGKTHVASNLAAALSQAQYRVLLVDADLRRPSVHEHFGAPLEPGLSNVLTGAASLRQALRTTAVPGLTLLTGGTPTAHAPELLGSAVFGELCGVFQEHFDWIIVDSPPVLSVADARIVASRMQAAVLVASAGTSPARAVRRALDELQRAGGRVMGVVLNRAQREHDSLYLVPYGPSTYPDSPSSGSETKRKVPAAASTEASV